MEQDNISNNNYQPVSPITNLQDQSTSKLNSSSIILYTGVIIVILLALVIGVYLFTKGNEKQITSNDKTPSTNANISLSPQPTQPDVVVMHQVKVIPLK